MGKRFSIYSESTAGVIFTLPFIIGFLLFMVVPMIMSLYYAFSDFNILSPPVFSGLKNFREMFKDETFWQSLRVTVFYAVVSVPLKLAFALAIAVLLKKTTKASGMYRAMYYLPSIIGGSVAVSILWKRMFAMDGMINRVLHSIGIENTPAWLGNKNTAIWTLILLTVWQFGSSMLIFLSSLKQIPTSFYEASTVDGAGRARQFFSITLPLLTPTIFFNLVMQMINGLLAFTQSYIITQGQPLNSTLFYMVYMYQQSFEFYSTGYGAALAWMMLVVVSIVTSLLFATRKRWVYDGGF
ncbi:MAG: sugar ABC transporter permease [Clostridiales bacterium]|jgi:multiple sugar transport system permease protein|nr:sugar ABC transporter permease [Clostridiales bacterium]